MNRQREPTVESTTRVTANSRKMSGIHDNATVIDNRAESFAVADETVVNRVLL